MNVFTDFHHASLLNSLIMLFEGRLGGNVYRPIGEEWYTNGFWKIYDHPATVNQYLGIGGATPDGSPKLNEVIGSDRASLILNARVYLCRDIEGDKTNKAVTFEGFLKLPIDIVIASIPQHLEPFKKLCELHPNKPKLIYQIGNAWNIPADSVKNVMASAVIHNIPEGVNFVSYHQEFDLSTFYPLFIKGGGLKNDNSFTAGTDEYQVNDLPRQNIYSFVNCFSTQDHFMVDWELFQSMERRMVDWMFSSYGGQCRDGNMNGSKELADKIRESRFVWHTKNGGDGFGHVIHNAAACGKPLIVKKQYYVDKLAEPLLIDGITCIAIDGLDPQQIKNKIEYFNEPENYTEMCQNVYDNFKKVVDFDKEEQDLRIFLSKLL